jgi:hypothetical protein
MSSLAPESRPDFVFSEQKGKTDANTYAERINEKIAEPGVTAWYQQLD